MVPELCIMQQRRLQAPAEAEQLCPRWVLGLLYTPLGVLDIDFVVRILQHGDDVLPNIPAAYRTMLRLRLQEEFDSRALGQDSAPSLEREMRLLGVPAHLPIYLSPEDAAL